MANSLAFYQALGFTIKYGDDTSAFSSLYAGPGYLNLERVKAGTGKSAGWGRAIFYVDDVDKQYALALGANITPEFSPRNAPWRERYFHVVDPDGHEVSFAKPI